MLGVVIETSRSQVIERPHVAIGLHTLLLEVFAEDVNLRPDKAIRGKWRIVG
jgi:hypothetical protein